MRMCSAGGADGAHCCCAVCGCAGIEGVRMKLCAVSLDHPCARARCGWGSCSEERYDNELDELEGRWETALADLEALQAKHDLLVKVRGLWSPAPLLSAACSCARSREQGPRIPVLFPLPCFVCDKFL